MANRYILTDEVRQKFTPVVKDFIDKVEAFDYESNKDLPEIDFSGTELNPSTLEEILKELGYEEDDIDRNGWQMDFWITMYKSDCRTLTIEGCGITFELKLCMKEIDYDEEE